MDAPEPAGKRQKTESGSVARGSDAQGLAMMVTDVEEDSSGSIVLWGLVAPGPQQQQPAGRRTCCCVVPDFQPYFLMPCPVKPAAQHSHGAALTQQDLQQLQQLLRGRLPLDCGLESLEVLQLNPVMYFRPAAPDGTPFLKLKLKPGASVKKAAGVVEKLVGSSLLTSAGFAWQRGSELYEVDVKLVTRFLCDTSLSGGSWVWLSPTASQQPTHTPIKAAQPTQQGASSSGSGGSSQARFEFRGEPGSSGRRSRCDVELVCSWRCLHSLTPDAVQLAQADWRPQVLQQLQPSPAALQSAAAAAAAGDILPLRLLVLDVLLAPADGSNRSANPAKDPIVTITSQLITTGSSSSGGVASNGNDSGSSEAAAAAAASSASKVAFVLAGAAAAVLPAELSAEGFSMRLHGSEAQLLSAWRSWLQQQDPDGLVVFQVRDNLGAIAARFAALRLDGGQCHISRAAGRTPLATKSVVMYSPAWVKSQSRMASTSNQETFRAEGLSGRIALDVLRQVLTSQSLATFSLVDCCQSLLGQTLEVLPPYQLAALQQQLAATPPPTDPAQGPGVSQAQLPGVRAGLRLARYSLTRVAAVADLVSRLASVPEMFEMARATGLTLDQVMYNAQMIRTWSLLLRTAHRHGYVVAGRMETSPLVESPHLLHPIEHKTAGLYNTPVATCDFASLYPSLYRAYNLCYTTLLRDKDDVARVGADNVTVSPTGAAFLKPSVRQGILPSILAALMTARASTRASLKDVQKQLNSTKQQQASAAARAAVLDGRQKALKLTANALYGFTGAQASPLQCVPLADTCLALGAATCRAAADTITAAIRDGRLGPRAAGGRVIYAQTDSVFTHFPNASAAEAVQLGEAAARLVTASLPPPIELKFERAMCPFMLLHVNRYAGRSFDSAAAAEAGAGQLLVKGVKAVWRQSAPILQTTLTGALERILMQRDVPGAVRFVEGQVARLLSGRVQLSELAMTGGLWRVTGQQLEKAAAAADGEGGSGGGAAAAGDGEEVRGPHASLAVRLSQRDPDKKWLLGERLSYVLLTGARTQDDAAEDPFTAAQLGLSPNFDLYWTNKLQAPLKEIFSTCLRPDEMRELLHGQHTTIRGSAAAAGEAIAQPSVQLVMSPGRAPPAAAAAAGVGSPAGRPPLASPGRGGRTPGAKQKGLTSFFQHKAKCLSCRQVISARPDGSGSRQPLAAVDPGLCQSCEAQDGKWEATYLAVVGEESAAAEQFAVAHSACRRCHSGGQMGLVVCENGECAVLYQRFGAERQLRTAEHKLQRLEW